MGGWVGYYNTRTCTHICLNLGAYTRSYPVSILQIINASLAKTGAQIIRFVQSYYDKCENRLSFKCSFQTCLNLFYFFKPLFPCSSQALLYSYFVYRIPKLLRVLMTLPSRFGTLDMVIYGFIFPIFLLAYVVIICIT